MITVYLELYQIAESLGLKTKRQKWAFVYLAQQAVHEDSGKINISYSHGKNYGITIEGKQLHFSSEVLRKTTEILERKGLLKREKGFYISKELNRKGELDLSSLREFLGEKEITPQQQTKDWTVQVYLDGKRVAAQRKKGVLREFYEYGETYKEILKNNTIEFSADLRKVYEDCAPDEALERMERAWVKDFQPTPINIHLHSIGGKEFGYGRLHCRTNSIQRFRKNFLTINGDGDLWELDIRHSVPQIILITKGVYKRGMDIYMALVGDLQKKGYGVSRETIKKTLLIFQNSRNEEQAKRGVYSNITKKNGFDLQEAQETRRAVKDGEFLKTVDRLYPDLKNTLLNKTEQDKVLFLEARVILGTMKALWKKYQIPSIYRYDALILPLKNGAISKMLIQETFRQTAKRVLGTELENTFSPLEKYQFPEPPEPEEHTSRFPGFASLGEARREAGTETTSPHEVRTQPTNEQKRKLDDTTNIGISLT